MDDHVPAACDDVHWFSSFDGMAIAYEVLRARRPRNGLAPGPETKDRRRGAGRDGTPVVLHHGFGSDMITNWSRPGVAARLLGAGLPVVLVDARGHGRSAKPHDPEAYAAPALTDDLGRLLDVVGAERVDLVGYSMGALVAIDLALRDDRVSRLVLAGVGISQVIGSSDHEHLEIAAGLEARDTRSVTSRTALAFRSFAEAVGADRLALAALQRAWPFSAVTGLLGRLHIPTLVLNGAEDTVAGEPQGLARAIPGAMCRQVPGNHMSAVTKAEFSGALVDFFA
ncbi:MAG: alpha/beta fold hydrolase [Acidimicrobiales bacterium]